MDCREPVAEEVQDKERANFCGYFQIRAGAFSRHGAADTHVARAQLDTLFGGVPGEKGETAARSETEVARELLDQLFSNGKGEI